MSEYRKFMDHNVADFLMNVNEVQIDEVFTQSSHLDVDVLYTLIANEIRKIHKITPMREPFLAEKDEARKEIGRLIEQFVEDYATSVADEKWCNS